MNDRNGGRKRSITNGPVAEPLSLDEAYLDVSTNDPAVPLTICPVPMPRNGWPTG